ncbi:hotdog family protein [Gordonia insulae]|uniref:hypothetical protein n=1 Tax=Gordonia insulae TaxID=2420509 RepID=UPI000F5BCFEB|nr:hypothetical protein [Gordonia insulae]
MSGVRVFEDLDDLVSSVGVVLGPTPWRRIDAQAIAGFASAVAPAQRFTRVVGHEYDLVSPDFLLSLIPGFVAQMRRIRGMRSGVNYGVDRVVYPSVVHVGDRVRARSTLAAVDWTGPASVALVASTDVEVCSDDEATTDGCRVALRGNLLSRIYC